MPALASLLDGTHTADLSRLGIGRAYHCRVRICSLLPSATEIVFAIGAGDRLVGVSHECDYPPAAIGLPRVTRSRLPAGLPSDEIDALVASSVGAGQSLYEIDTALLESLRPDLIITQLLCDVCAVTTDHVEQALSALPRRPRVLSLGSHSLDDILGDIGRVGDAAGQEKQATTLLDQLRHRIEAVRQKTQNLEPRPRVTCLEWLNPPFSAGHWMADLVDIAGGRDDLAPRHRPSVRIDWQFVRDYGPEILVLTLCGFDLLQCVQEARRLSALAGFESLPATRAGRLYATDGSAYFSRPGPRIVDGLEVLAHLIHPNVFKPPALPHAFMAL